MTTDIDTSGRIYDVKTVVANAIVSYGANMPVLERTAAVAALTAPSPVDCIAQFAQAGYSALKKGIADAPTEAALAQAVGQCAYQIIANSFGHVEAITAQGYYAACRRWLGATTTPDPATDPAIPTQFQPTAPSPTPSAAVTPTPGASA